MRCTEGLIHKDTWYRIERLVLKDMCNQMCGRKHVLKFVNDEILTL
jgi:hypothetical protein